MRPLLKIEIQALLEGWPLVRAILDTIIHCIRPYKRKTSVKGWPQIGGPLYNF